MLLAVEQKLLGVVTDGFWHRRFGGDPRILGQKIVIDGQPFIVVGVLPSTFYFLWPDSAIFMPLPVDANFRSGRAARNVALLARAAPGVSQGQAQAEIARLAHDLAIACPATNGLLVDTNVTMKPMSIATSRPRTST
jgi:putative ABC transport system permease protein